MKLRHVASLALVGWYLLIPNPRRPKISLIFWTGEGLYGTLAECEQHRRNWIECADRPDYRTPNGKLCGREGGAFTVDEDRKALKLSRCVPSSEFLKMGRAADQSMKSRHSN
jgi:hypothetical protein